MGMSDPDRGDRYPLLNAQAWQCLGLDQESPSHFLPPSVFKYTDNRHPPGNFWYHCMASTFGSWLRGDPRGWCSHHCREHVEGNYKHPLAPGKYDLQLERSHLLLNRPQVLLTHAQQVLVCQSMATKLDSWQTPWVDLCVTASYFHLHVQLNPSGSMTAALGLKQDNRLQDGRNPLPRHVVGRLKKHASHILRQRDM